MTRKEIIHLGLCLKRLIYRVNQIKLQGLVSRKTLKLFGPEGKF